MNDERWTIVDRLLGAALEREPHERAAYLREACGDDEVLRREVESLVAHASSGAGVVSTPAVSFADGIRSTGTSMIGRQVGPYVVGALIGAGGMGEVYRARDTKLHRDVAIKVLPVDVAHDSARLARFRREAQVLASLNHPHIAAIYGFEETSRSPALVMELVEGQTLANRLQRGPMPVGEVLRVSEEIAEALEAAHERGVVHRDLKPGNVMLRTDGTVKVLDFGLAKALARDDGPTDSQRATISLAATAGGMVAGTPAYMAPEQVRGEAIDHRTDIWAFGCVLYEMLTGRAAFGAPTSAESFAKVLEGRADLETLPDHTPPSIRRLVRRCLDRSPRNRVQHIGDARADLADARTGEPVRGETGAPLTARHSSTPQAKSGHRTAVAIVGVAVVALIASGLFVLMSYRSGGEGADDWSLNRAVVEQLTVSGNAWLPALSPDGRFVAFVQKHPGGDSLHVRRTHPATISTDEIVPAQTGLFIEAVTVAPDNEFVHYVTRGNGPYVLWRVPFGGGPPQPILEDVHSAISWSPDGNRFAFVRAKGLDETELVIADVNDIRSTKRVRVLSTQSVDKDGRVFLALIHPFGHGGPAWSPDGKVIAISSASAENGGTATGTALFVNVDKGSVSVASPGTFGWGEWVDELSLLWVRSPEPGALSQLFSLSLPSLRLVRRANDVNDYQSVSFSKDRNLLVASRTVAESEIRIGDGSGMNGVEIDASAVRPKATGAQPGGQIAWAGNQVLYGGFSSGRLTLWAARRDEEPRRIVDTADSPAVTTDGRTIAYVSRAESEGATLFRADIDGRNRRRLATDAHWPVITRDNRYVIFTSGGGSRTQTTSLYRVPLEGGEEETLLADVESRNPDISLDGTMLAFLNSSGPRGLTDIAICALPRCPTVRRFAPRGLPERTSQIRWTPKGDGIAYVNTTDGPNIWIQPLDESLRLRKLTNFTDGLAIEAFAWSQDGSHLAILRAKATTDIVLYRGILHSPPRVQGTR